MSKAINLPPSLFDYDFKKLAKSTAHPRERIRLMGLHHLQQGKSYRQVSQSLQVNISKAKSWLYKFRDFGLAGIAEQPRSGRKSKRVASGIDEASIVTSIEKLQNDRVGGRITLEDIKTMLSNEYGIEYQSVSGVHYLVTKLGLSWISARSRHPKHNAEQQELYKKKFKEQAVEVLPAGTCLANVDIWFQDESRVGQQGSITRMWAPKGTRPRAVRQQQFEYAYIYGAACPARDEAVALVLPWANTQGMIEHMRLISQATQEGRHALVIMDRAGWHMSKEIRRFDNVSILPLPAYAPELNPVEQLWQQLKQRHLSNRCFNNYDDIVDACCTAWNTTTNQLGFIQSLCTRNWASLG